MSSSIKCALCGASNSTHYSFCIKCGNKFTHVEFSGKSKGFQTSKIDRRPLIHSSSSFPYVPRRRSSINYKLLGIGFILIIGVTISGFFLFGTFLVDLSTNTVDYDEVTQVLTDSQGNIFVLGGTNSLDFPSTFNDTSKMNSSYYPWDQDAFITKFSSDGKLLWSRVIGGFQMDICFDGAIDTENNIIVMGYTESEEFPITKEWYQHDYSEMFLLKLTQNGTILWSSTYPIGWLSGFNGITLDSQDNIIITSCIYGNESYPTATYNVLEPYSENVLIHKLSSNGSLIWTYIVGGTGDDYGKSVEVDNADNIIVCGETSSTVFPSTGANSYYNETGYQKGFILKLQPNAELMWSNLIGGYRYDEPSELLVDNDFIFMAGMTYSPDFPIINASTEGNLDYYRGFITKYSYDGTLLWSNCFSVGSYFHHFALDGNESVIGIGGASTDNSGYDYDCVLWIISQTDSSLSQKITFGGNSYDCGVAIANYNDNGFLLAGSTSSKDFPLVDAYDSTLAGHSDIFVLKYDINEGIKWGTLLGGSGREYGLI